ncbi:MAG: hypothetical protein SFW67_35500 [Myxococcaceae bacterium]|nr:hypothetical protein [Myxococcaceae bacterium]
MATQLHQHAHEIAGLRQTVHRIELSLDRMADRLTAYGPMLESILKRQAEILDALSPGLLVKVRKARKR